MKTIAAIAFVLSISACATNGPAYWMKSYPNASAEKTQKCLDIANAVYDKNVTNTAFGVGPILEKGLAWEKCQDGA